MRPAPIRRAAARLGAIGVLAGYAALALALLYRPSPADGMGPVETLLTWCSLMGTTFLPHAGMALLVALCILLLLRARKAALAGLPLLAISLGPWLLSFAPPGPRTPPTPPTPDGSLLVLSANLLASTRSEEQLFAQIREHRPDVILVQEVRDASAARLHAALDDEYHSVAILREDNFGQAVFSRLPFTRDPVIAPLDDSNPLPQISAFIEFEGRELCLWNIHLTSPLNLTRTAEQAAMAWRMGAYLDDLAARGAPAIVGGDFNAPWGAQPLDALRTRGYREAHRAAGEGPGATWPRITPLKYAPGITLDHIAFPAQLECLQAWAGEDTGSDHKPIFARLAWRR
ncbi:MAG: endonuclease/exonuclease/phosphatase family protein [Phycisphaerales bacterium]|nr:endonuclease/exonuclease/phosphatase family protein [Phycisphaerales bacterium]